MKIRIFSDIHLDVNEGFPFSMREGEKDDFTLIAGDVSGNVKLTSKWIRDNIKQGMFVVGNHDPSYNDLPWTIQRQKEYLHERHGLENPVTFLDEAVGVMCKEIPGTNVLVVGSALYTDYKYMAEDERKYLEQGNEWRKEHGEENITVVDANKARAARGLNDFRWGKVEDEFDDRRLKQRPVRPDDYEKWFAVTFKKIKEIVESNPEKDIIVLTHHCPSTQLISADYLHDTMNASYVSDLEGFILEHPNIKAWCCGHVHSVKICQIGEKGQWLICNPRGYERDYNTRNWTPNVYLDTDTWTVESLPYENKKLESARKKFDDKFMKYAPLFF